MANFIGTFSKGEKWSDDALRATARRQQVAFLEEAAKRGIVVIAGDVDEQGERLVIVNAPSLISARRFVARDPSVKAGVYVVCVREIEVDES